MRGTDRRIDRHPRNERRGASSFYARRSEGWGLNLYRNAQDGIVAGVAAGLADYCDVAPWVVRLLWVGAFLFTGTLALWVYLVAWFLMVRRPARSSSSGSNEDELEFEDVPIDMEYDERRHGYRPRKVFRYSDSSSARLKKATERLDAALRRVEEMESYVTSRQYRLNREFSALQAADHRTESR